MEPTERDLNDPLFNAIWNAIKSWDLSRGRNEQGLRLYSDATGTDAMAILHAVRGTGYAGTVNSDCFNAAEALFAFVGWLTTRQEYVVLNNESDVYRVTCLMRAFITRHQLHDVRDGWEKRIVREDEPVTPTP